MPGQFFLTTKKMLVCSLLSLGHITCGELDLILFLLHPSPVSRSTKEPSSSSYLWEKFWPGVWYHMDDKKTTSFWQDWSVCVRLCVRACQNCEGLPERFRMTCGWMTIVSLKNGGDSWIREHSVLWHKIIAWKLSVQNHLKRPLQGRKGKRWYLC